MAARPELVHIRAEDGRGPLWWAYEYQEAAVIDFLLARPGMRTDLRDKDGATPDMMGGGGAGDDDDDDDDDEEYL